MNKHFCIAFFIGLLGLCLSHLTSCERPSPCDGFECNYGNCVITPEGTPKCDCYPGYYGDNCPYENYDPCMVLECANGGTCQVDSADSRKAHCICLGGFEGEHCEYANPCYTNNGGCVNGTCRDSLGLVLCDCLPGYTGTLCDQIDYCYGINCTENAHCNSETGVCQCNTGYEFAPSCNQQIRTKFIGTYIANDSCANVNSGAYSAYIVADDSNISKIKISNFGNKNGITVTAEVSETNKFVILATQTYQVASNTYRIIAPPKITGTLNSDSTLTFSYQYSLNAGDTITCYTTMAKQ